MSEANSISSGQEKAARPLSDSELSALFQCEDAIRKGHEIALQAYVRIGRALKRIRDESLHRARHRTFEAYCAQAWGMSDRHARHNIRASEVYDALEGQHFMTLPVAESQARPMTELPPAEWVAAWEEVIGTAPDGRVTGKHVRAVVDRRLNRLDPVLADGHLADGKAADEAPVDETPGDEAEPASNVLDLRMAIYNFGGPLVPLSTLSQSTAPIIDVPDLSTREKRVRELAIAAQDILFDLRDAIGTADAVASSGVVSAILGMDDLQHHLQRKERMLSNRQKETETDK